MKKKIWIVGLVIIFGGSLINGLLIRNEIGRLIREAACLTILVGIVILIIGLIRKLKKPPH